MDNIDITDCLCCWCDLLGYGKAFVESGWNLRDSRCQKNFERIAKLGKQLTFTLAARQVGTKLIFNDGFASTIDIVPTNKERYMDILYFIEGIIQDFQSLNITDKRNGFPGARSVLSIGHRFSYDGCNHSYDLLQNRTTAFYPNEFQMNTAFSKAYIMEESGSKANISGSNLYIDRAVFDFLKEAAQELECTPPECLKEKDRIVMKLYSPSGWFADIYFDTDTITYGESSQYENRGIETTLYRYQRIHSIIDEIASEAALQQSYRYSIMEDDE